MTWIDDFFINNMFEHIDSKMILTLKIMDFENVALTKVVHIYVIKGYECIINMI
jgi:hypothetical protein